MAERSSHIEGVPLQRIFLAGECLIASAYMIVGYWYKNRLSGVENFLSYDEFRSLFPSPRSIQFTGPPPNKLWDYIKKNSILKKTFRIHHRKKRRVGTLELLIRQKSPLIVPFDIGYYQTQIESRATHYTVLRGFTPETFKANNPTHGENYSYEKIRFEKAWQNRGGRYILIKPHIKGSIEKWLT